MDKKDAGLHLIEKNRKITLSSVLLSRLGLIVVFLLVQMGLLGAVFVWFESFLPHYFGSTVIFTAIMVLFLINSSMNPSAKITWLVLIMILPVFGALLYWYTQSDAGHRTLKKHYEKRLSESRTILPQNREDMEDLRADSPGTARLAEYLSHCGCHPVYRRTDAKYLPSGEEKLEAVLQELEKAEKFIFLEYFIVEEGTMWGRILEILARKARAGVDVRVMYDGTCEFSSLTHDYPKRLQTLGIRAKMFAPATVFFSTHYNYRDHRKILVIDGKVAFTGGVNLADRYINIGSPYGHWKDTALLIRGEAVRSFTLLFLQMWSMGEKTADYQPWLSLPGATVPRAPGYVIPFGDSPLDKNKVGQMVYMDILNRATEYVHIMTPYLVLDGEMETALKFAAQRGVDIKLILPGKADKLSAFALAKTHYAPLLHAGVKIYEYDPGFVHAKVFVADGNTAVVGTINMDYRSLYHHFECAAFLYKTACIPSIEEDFQKTLSRCHAVTPETLQQEKWWLRLMGKLLKAVAPLL